MTAERAVDGYRAADPRVDAFVDERSLDGQLSVRAHRPGDRMRPLGAPGSRAIQDILVDLRVPAYLRRRVPVVLSGERIVWLCGLAVTQESRITGDTQAVVRFRVIPGLLG